MISFSSIFRTTFCNILHQVNYKIRDSKIFYINFDTMTLTLTSVYKCCKNAYSRIERRYFQMINKLQQINQRKIVSQCTILCIVFKIRLCISSNLFNYELLRKYYVRYSIYVGITYAFAILLGQSCIPLLCSLLFKDLSTIDVLF